MSFPQRGGGCTQHCLIWFGGDPTVKIGCAHCSFISSQLDLRATYNDEQVGAAVDSSRSGHGRLCSRPRRDPTRRPQPTRRRPRAQ